MQSGCVHSYTDVGCTSAASTTMSVSESRCKKVWISGSHMMIPFHWVKCSWQFCTLHSVTDHQQRCIYRLPNNIWITTDMSKVFWINKNDCREQRADVCTCSCTCLSGSSVVCMCKHLRWDWDTIFLWLRALESTWLLLIPDAVDNGCLVRSRPENAQIPLHLKRFIIWQNQAYTQTFCLLQLTQKPHLSCHICIRKYEEFRSISKSIWPLFF